MRRAAALLQPPIAAFVTLAVLAAATPAEAAVSCAYDAVEHQVTVDFDGGFDDVLIARDGDELHVDGQQCGTATVDNTDLILVEGQSPQAEIELDASQPFAPGFTDEPGSSDEIEMVIGVALGETYLTVSGSTIEDDHMRVGKVSGDGALNLNADELSGIDHDVLFTNVEAMLLNGRAGDDHLRAGGGVGTGSGYDGLVVMQGGLGEDELEGGSQDDTLLGGVDGDLIWGGGGDDVIEPGHGNDEIAGQGGFDMVSYADALGGVEVDLGIAGPQPTGASGNDTLASVEGLSGSPHADVLQGDEGPNRLLGYVGDDLLQGHGGDDVLNSVGGSDRLEGGTGRDTLSSDAELESEMMIGGPDEDVIHGGPAADTIDSRDASADQVDCGDSPDRLTADGLDVIAADCESVALPPGPGPGPGGGEGPVGDRTGPPATTTDRVRPTLSRLRLSPRTFPAARRGSALAGARPARVPPKRETTGARLGYTLSEPATVRFQVSRLSAGRRAGGRCRKPTVRSRGGRRCTRAVTLKGSFTHSSTAGPATLRFSGRLARRALRPGRYELLAVATDTAGNHSASQRVRFRITPRPRHVPVL